MNGCVVYLMDGCINVSYGWIGGRCVGSMDGVFDGLLYGWMNCLFEQMVLWLDGWRY